MQLFAMCIPDNHFSDIIHFLMMGMAPEGYTSQQKKELVVWRHTFLSLQDIYIKWAQKKFYDVMYLSLNGTKSSLKLMEELQEDIMWEKQQRRRFYTLGCGGRHCIRIPRLTVRNVMHVRG